MKNNSQDILFITSQAERGLFLLGRMLHDRGFSVTIAAAQDENSKFWLWGQFVRIRRIGKYLLPNKNVAAKQYDRIFTLDGHASKFATRAKLNFTEIDLDFGLDPNIWTPDAAGAARQTRFLSEFGIAPSMRMCAVISPLGYKLDQLLLAVETIQKNDVTFALLGHAKRSAAKRVLKQISNAKSYDKFMCVGDVLDRATFLRAANMVISLGDDDEILLKQAVSMGRPTIWDKNDFEIASNIQIKNNLAGALEKGLNLSANERDNFENKNLDAAKKFSIDKTIKEFLSYL